MEFLKKYTSEKNLKLKKDDIKEKYLCGICNEILCDPKLSKCGCSFCSTCLNVYLDGKIKLCPHCKEIEIGSGDDIQIDWRIQKKILKLMITCPNLRCDYKYNIKDMESHLKQCTESKIKCCLDSYGCLSSFDDNLSLKNHLVEEINEHFSLMKNKIKNFEDEIHQVETESNEKVIQNKVEIEMKIEQADEVLREQIVAGDEVLRQNVESLQQHIVKIEEENKALEEKMKEEREEWKKEMWNLKEEMTKIMNEKLELSKKSMTIGEYYVAVDEEAKVKFTNVSKGRRPALCCGDNIYIDYFSNDFKLNKYNFNVGIYNYNPSNLIQFTLHIVPGCNDAELEWPLKNRIEMVILRKDGKVYQTLSFQYSESLEEWKPYYGRQTSRYNFIQESRCHAYKYNLINSHDEVYLIIKMLK